MKEITQKILAGTSFLLLLLGLFWMGQNKPVQAVKAVYHWKTAFDESWESGARDSFLEEHSIRKVYVKMLDVDYSEAAGIFPASKTNMPYSFSHIFDSVTFVPVIYISNSVMKNMKLDQIEFFSKQFLVHALRIETYTKKKVSEIQVDCDWTEGTKETYFQILKTMKKWAPQMQFSVTLRLYPYKYREELGIPPADRVMLMVYNINNAKKFSNKNSIFDAHEASKYLKRKSYPLPMDIALPVFSWSLIFRNQQFLKVFSSSIIPTIYKREIEDESKESCLKKLTNKMYLVQQKPNGYDEFDLRAGDIIKIESCGEMELKEASLITYGLPINESSTIALFDLDMNDLNQISYDQIENAFTLFH
jgi:hypothetical protein